MDILKKNKKQFPQYLYFIYGMIYLNYSLKKLCKTFKLQNEILKIEMNHDEVNGNKYKDRKMIG